MDTEAGNAVRVAGNVVRLAAHARACGEVLTVAHDGEHDAHCVQARLRSAISGGMLEEGEVVEEEAAPHMTAAAGIEVEPLHPGAAESQGGSGALLLPLADGALAAASDCAPPSAALAHDAEAHRKRAPAAREEPDRSRREAGAGTCDGALALPPGWTQHWSRTKNKAFYRFTATGETTWEAPRKPKLSFGQVAASPAAPPGQKQEVTVMKELGVALQSHEEVEGRVIAQIEAAARHREEQKEQADIEKRLANVRRLQANVEAVMKKMDMPAYSSSFQQSALKEQLKNLQNKISGLRELDRQAELRVAAEEDVREVGGSPDAAVRVLQGVGAVAETERQRMIRTGLITPFDGRAQMERARVALNQKAAKAAAHTPRSANGKDSAVSTGGRRAQSNSTPALSEKKATVPNARRQRIESYSKASGGGHRRQSRSKKNGSVDDGDALAWQARQNERKRGARALKRKNDEKDAVSSEEEDLFLGSDSSRFTERVRKGARAEAKEASGVQSAASGARFAARANSSVAPPVSERQQIRRALEESKRTEGRKRARRTDSGVFPPVRMPVCMHACTNVCMYVCMHVCMLWCYGALMLWC